VVTKIESDGGEAAFAHVEVTSANDVERLVTETVERYGGLDVAVNNAGVLTAMVPLGLVTDEHWERILEINLGGVLNCMREELLRMVDSGGSIVNVASVAGLVGMPTVGGYSASKHGVVGLTRSAALEYVEQDVRINAFDPGRRRPTSRRRAATTAASGSCRSSPRRPHRARGFPEGC